MRGFRIFIAMLLVVIFVFPLTLSVHAVFPYMPILEFGSYSFTYDFTHNFSFTELPLPVDYDLGPFLPVNIKIYDMVYMDSWKPAGNGMYYLGNRSLLDPSFSDTGEPYFFGFNPGVRFACILVGPAPSDPGVPMEVWQGDKPDPPDVSIRDSAITDMLGYILGWWSIMWYSFTAGPLSGLLPLLAVGVAVPFIFVVIKLIHRHL